MEGILGRHGQLGGKAQGWGGWQMPSALFLIIFLFPLSSSYKLLPRIIEAKYLDAMDAEH